MTIAYDAGELNEVSVLMKWRGTIMPMVLTRPVIYILVSIHYLFLYMHLERPDITMPELDWKICQVPTSLLTFFLVFYSGNCFQRYYGLYGKCTGMAGAMMNWVGLCRIFFNSASTETLWNLSRHMLASVYVQYFTLGGDASDGGKTITEAEWATIMRHRMLSEQEKQQVMASPGFKPFLLQCWGLQTLNEYLANPENKRAAGAAVGPFQAQAFALRQHCSDMVNTLAQPVPFPYFHAVTFMLSINLIIVAYALIFFDTYMSVPCFFVTCLVMQGLKECAVALSDPFGGDDVDFDTASFMQQVLNSTKALISRDAIFKPGTKLECPPEQVVIGQRVAKDAAYSA